MKNAKKTKRRGRILALTMAAGLAALSMVPGAPAGLPVYAADSGSDFYIGNGNALYEPLKITGVRMPEEQIFSSEELLRVMDGLPDVVADAPYDGDESPQPEKGVDLKVFLKYCGADLESADTRISIRNGDPGSVYSFSAADLNEGTVSAVLRIPENNDQAREAIINDKNGRTVIGYPEVIIVGSEENMEDPMYWKHDHDPFLYMAPEVFTVNFVDRAVYSDKDDAMKPFRTVRLTLGDLEKLITEHPEEVHGNYFGMSGNEETKNTMGLGGFFDYYEGLDLDWFLTEYCGLKKGEGSAVLYGRDYDRFGQIRSLDYFFPEVYDDYYLEMTKEYTVSCVVPVLAVSKNGCPLLPVHDHDIEGNYEYNTFNANAIKAGFSSKIGIQKNVSGPMIAALANLDGVYGGYQNETSGDCVRIDLYVDKSLYSEDSSEKVSFGDVPDNAWYADYVKTLVRRGVVNGMTPTAFEPDGRLTRAQFVKMLACESNDAPGYLPDLPFKDVDVNGWSWPYIRWAYDHEIVNGTSADSFSPDALISRQDMAVIIDRYLKYKGISLDARMDVRTFTDEADIADYAKPAVHFLTGNLLSGYPDGTFRPKAGATRAEAAKVLCMTLDLDN